MKQKRFADTIQIQNKNQLELEWKMYFDLN